MSRLANIILALALPWLVCASADAEAESLQSRIDSAQPGEVIEVRGGTHGPIRTDKSITLRGVGSPIIDGGGSSDCVVMVGGDSAITGFIIRNSGKDLDRESCGLRVMGPRTTIADNRFQNVLFGIDLKQAPDCVIRQNIIGSMPLDIARRGDALRLFKSDRCLIEANTIEDGRDALVWYSDHVTVRKNISRRNRYGFHMMFANHTVLEDNLITDNSVGIYLMYGKGFTVRNNQLLRNRGPSGYGIGFKEVDEYQITSNVLSGNRVGIYLDGSPLRRRAGGAFIERNSIVCNDIGFSFLPAVKGNFIRHNNVVDNVEQLAVQGRGSVQSNEVVSNFWSDFPGYDADNDGIGDQPYESRKLFESLIDREPRLRLFLFSPAHDAIEFVGKALPSVAPSVKFSDPLPLVSPVSLVLPQISSPARQMSIAAWLLFLPAAAVCLFCGRSFLQSRARLP
jgi:nitrous oxidase accessory protein